VVHETEVREFQEGRYTTGQPRETLEAHSTDDGERGVGPTKNLSPGGRTDRNRTEERGRSVPAHAPNEQGSGSEKSRDAKAHTLRSGAVSPQSLPDAQLEARLEILQLLAAVLRRSGPICRIALLSWPLVDALLSLIWDPAVSPIAMRQVLASCTACTAYLPILPDCLYFSFCLLNYLRHLHKKVLRLSSDERGGPPSEHRSPPLGRSWS
jgi:hypothetical protein